MRLILALCYRQLLLLPRKKYFRCKRVAFVVFVSGFSLMSIYMSLLQDPNMLGLRLFSTFSILLFGVMVFLAPATGAALITQEIGQHTLGLLLLSDLTCGGIIVGKFLHQYVFLLLSYLSCLPLLMVSISFGGISGAQIIAVLSVLLAFLAVATAWGLLAATLGNAKNAEGEAVLLMIVILALSALLATITDNIYSSQPTFWNMLARSASTTWALTNALSGQSLELCYYNTIFNLVLACVLLYWSARWLPKTYRRSQTTPWHIRFRRGLVNKLEGWRRKQAPRTPSATCTSTVAVFPKTSLLARKLRYYKSCSLNDEHPIIWRDYYKMYGGSMADIGKILLLGCIVVVVLCAAPRQERLLWLTSCMIATSILIGSIYMFSRCLQAFAVEKEQGTLPLLLSSGLSEEEILRGKIGAILKSSRIFWYCAIIFLALIATVVAPSQVWTLQKLLNFIAFGFYGGAYICMVCSCALFFSLRCQKEGHTRAYTVLCLFLWHIGNNIIFGILCPALDMSTQYRKVYICYGFIYALLTYYLLRQISKKMRVYALA